MMNVHEILLPNVISSDSKERIKLLLNSKKGRAKFISKLDHFNAFENKYITNLPSNFTTEMPWIVFMEEVSVALYLVSQESCCIMKEKICV